MHRARTKGEGSPEPIPRILLVGNPNVGKSVIFSALTGKYVTVSNYPGTTVEVSRGNARLLGRRWQIVDTPGVNNLIPHSEDERVTRDLLMEEEGGRVIQVADAKNLRRALMITLELCEMGLPQMLVLNMEDEARNAGIRIDTKRLSDILGIPVVTTVATRKKGIDKVIQELENMRPGIDSTRFSRDLENAISSIEGLLPQGPLRKRALAVMLLSGDESLSGWLNSKVPEEKIEKIGAICRNAQKAYGEPLAYVINTQRLARVDEIVEEVLEKGPSIPGKFSERLGDICMHPFWGLPILAMVLLTLYFLVGYVGAGILVDLMEEEVFEKFIVPLAHYMVSWIPVELFRDALVGQYGIVTMGLTYAFAVVLPIVATFFLAFGVLEDSGYMPRLGVLSNRAFRVVGLSGKAVLPMLLGLGCDTMATLTARILDTRRERILVTLLLALGVPCSAQLGVILGMLGGLSHKAVLLWAAVVLGTMVFAGYGASRVLPGEEGAFVLEVPPMRMPQLKNVLIKTLARVEWYLREAVPLFILATFILFLLDKLELLSLIQRLGRPLVVSWLGLPERATEAFLVGFLRRDYGAAGLYSLARDGLMDSHQIVVSLVTITLFVPCVANLLIIAKERGWRTALALLGVIFPLAFAVGGILAVFLRHTRWAL